MKKNKPKASKKIKILLADDHSVLRDCLKDVLDQQKELQVVGDAATGHECVKLAKQYKPDVILMDLKLPDISGTEATRLIKKENPEIKILILSTYDDDLHIMEAFQAGVDGYLSKVTPAQEMIEYLKKIYEKGALVPESILPKLLRGVREMGSKSEQRTLITDLTSAELRVLNLIKGGVDNKGIAKELGIGSKTVRNHLSSIFIKLEAKNRTEAVVKAIAMGVLSVDE